MFVFPRFCDAQELKSKKGGSSLEMFEGQTPEQVLERIQVGNDVWCLVKFPGGSNDDEFK